MFFRKITTRSNGKEYTYVKLIENYRKGNKVKQRVIANLGNIEDLHPPVVHNLITSLSKVCGLELPIKAKPKTKRILRFGDVMLVHKIWDRLGLTWASGNFHNPAPETALTLELLVLARLLNLPPVVFQEWRRHIYLPAPEHINALAPEEALDWLAENKEYLEARVFNRLQEWGKISSPIYCYLLKGRLESSVPETGHFLSQPPERQLFTLDLFATPEGLPIGQQVFFRTGGRENAAERIAHNQEYKGSRCLLVGDGQALTEENQQLLCARGQEYITTLAMSSPKAQQFYRYGLLTDSGEGYFMLREDLWYKEIREDYTRYLLCCNPLLTPGPERDTKYFQQHHQGKLIIKSNAKNLSNAEIIRAYNDFVSFKERYRLIRSICPFSPASGKGEIYIVALAQLVEKLLELILQKQGMNLTASTVLQMMEPVKLTINEVAGELIPSTIMMDKTQRKILSATDAGVCFDTTDFSSGLSVRPDDLPPEKDPEAPFCSLSVPG